MRWAVRRRGHDKVRHIPLRDSARWAAWPLCGGFHHNNLWWLSQSKETLALPVCKDCIRIGERISRQLQETSK